MTSLRKNWILFKKNKINLKMKQNILKNLENYPYYKILKIPNQKDNELKAKFLLYATKLEEYVLKTMIRIK